MTVHRRGPAAAVTAASPQTLGDVYLGTKYARVMGFQARNWASSAKAGAGTDAAAKISLTDANGMIFYLDASDRDYKTGNVFAFIRYDDTITGLSQIYVDATGAAVAADTEQFPVVKSPVTVKVTNATTVTDYFEVYLFVESGAEPVLRSTR